MLSLLYVLQYNFSNLLYKSQLSYVKARHKNDPREERLWSFCNNKSEEYLQ